jgi:hypothetical protein
MEANMRAKEMVRGACTETKQAASPLPPQHPVRTSELQFDFV